MITLRFKRFNDGVFVPHVDVLRSLNRTFRRAGIDVRYSNGFNRHMVLRLTQPIPFGVADDDAYVTADIKSDFPLEEIFDKFVKACPPYIRPLGAYVTELNPSLGGTINASSYRVQGKLNVEQAEKINAVFGKALQHSTVYGVRPRGKADGVDIAAVEMRLCRGEKRRLLMYGDGGEAAPVKRQLPLCPRAGQGGCVLYRFVNIPRRGGNGAAGYSALIAEHTVVRAAQMRHEHGDYTFTRAHSPSASSAPRAAICSASFFVLPLPSPAATPFIYTRKVKTLLWSGPRSSESS